MYCQVIVDIVHENVAHTFTYVIPEGLKLEVGQRILVPFGKREKEGIVVSIDDKTDFDIERIRTVIQQLENYPAILPPMMELAQEMADQTHCPLAETLRLMLPAEMRGGRIHVKTTQKYYLAVTPEQAEELILQEKRSEKRKQILRLLLDGHGLSSAEIGSQIQNPRETLKKMEKDRLIRSEEEEQLRTPQNSFEDLTAEWHPLTPEQREVLDEILPELEKGQGRFLLHGVTGSGKTEVFMNAVQQTLEKGKSAIILVPEIALTPQMVNWFRKRFGPVAAVLHSMLSPGERYDEWRRIRRGDAKVVIGARSAVFAPTPHLGLIVVDEEHESTYINDHRPRYDARDVALSRCSRENATLILASATPSMLSFAKARRGDYMLLEMPKRVQDRPLPEVKLVDMRRELELGNRSILSIDLQQALGACMHRNEQAMLLMNRRGYHSFVSCRSCGYVVKCPNCDVSMTYHLVENDGKLRCHYCGEVKPVPKECPKCRSPYIRYFGAGTQKLEEEVQRFLPGIRTARMDIDTTRGKDGHGRILEEFRSGKARILIGTQMIAKGLDFPEVTLVGVIAADMTLNLPDYRSRERTFQLLTQVAGRSGRGTKPGKVIIQTYQPEDPVLEYAARQDYRAFFEDEFIRRRKSLYPPFTIMARLLVEGTELENVNRTTCELFQEIKTLLENKPAWKKKVLMMINDVPTIRILRGKNRRHLLFKLLTGEATDSLCGALTELSEKARNGTDVYFEYNPTNMM